MVYISISNICGVYTYIDIPTPFSQLKNYFVILHYISAINFAIIRKSLVEVNYAIKNLAFLHTIIYLSCLYGYVYICNNMFCIYVCLSSCVLANCLAICFCSEMFLGLLHFLLTLPLDVDCLGWSFSLICQEHNEDDDDKVNLILNSYITHRLPRML